MIQIGWLKRLSLTAPLALCVLVGLGTLSSCTQAGAGSIGLPGCVNGQGLCVVSCNLGCGVTGCSITEIAVNQPLSFDFNLDINPDTVTENSLKLRTPTGNSPVGIFLVQANTVFFFPQAETVGGKTFFGFESGETYTLTIPSATDSFEAIESMSGDKLVTSFECRLKVSRGIVDFDGKPPTASILIPNIATCADRNTAILLEFSEIIDAQTLLGDNKTSGVKVALAQFSRQSGLCGTTAQPITGTRTISVNTALQRTQLLFRPAFELPGDFCVIVTVTEVVRDLSGKRAKEVIFTFKTCAGGQTDKNLVEDFSDPKRTLDELRNGANWSANAATPALVGGSGRLGDFDIAFGGKDTGLKDADGRDIWEWDTDSTTVPDLKTLTGKIEHVANGIFEFLAFTLPESKHLRFVGSNPPVIKVTGRMEVAGMISQAGRDGVRDNPPPPMPVKGQEPQPPAVGAGAGGRGGDSPARSGPKDIHGSEGEAAKVPAGHPLAGAVSTTGGKGSRANPESGATKDVKFSAYGGSICQTGAAGGGGGGMSVPGGGGSCIDNKGRGTYKPEAYDFGKPSFGGTGLDFTKLQNRSESSGVIFQLGGSGGGGSGTHPHGSFTSQIKFNPGFAGASGGGPLWLKIGGDLLVSVQGRISCAGGNGQFYDYNASSFFNPAPGGGGGGGGLLMQVGGTPDFRGKVLAVGGRAGRMHSEPAFLLRLDCVSGAGGDGFIRYESRPKVNKTALGTFDPAVTDANIGDLRAVDEDDLTVLATNWYDTNLFFPPLFVKYVIKARINNKDVVFSDDPTVGIKADESQPITVYLQGSQLDPDTKEPDPDSISKWFMGAVDPLNTKGGNGVRFLVRFNRAIAANIVLVEFLLHYRG